MKDNNIIQQKSYQFSIRIIKLYQFLSQEKKEFVLSKQILRSGTSIGANIEEAIGGQSEKDFFAKICVAHKEALETRYWLNLLRDTDILTLDQVASLLESIEEIIKILSRIKITCLNKNN